MLGPGTAPQFFNVEIEGLAKRSAEVYFQAHPQHAEQFGSRGRELSQQDFVYHFRYLAESLRLNEPALFADHIAWTKVLLDRLNLPGNMLRDGLQSMREVVANEITGEIRLAALARIESVLTSLPDFPPDLPGLIEPGTPHANLAREYLEALLEGDRRLASRLVMEAIDAGADLRDIYLWVFQRCQYEVGRLWQTNRISVAQEHFCTASAQMVMSQLYPRIFATERNGRRMVAACVGGDLHEIGLRMISDFFEMDGWDTFFLGANTPSDSVVRMVIDRQAHLLGISVTMTFHLPNAIDLIRRVKDNTRTSGLPVLIGGGPFNRAPDLWRTVGADGFARDAGEAVEVANNILAALTR